GDGAGGGEGGAAEEFDPGGGAGGPGDRAPRVDLDGEDRAVGRVDVEQAAPFDDETDLVFVVPVLAAELREHHVEVRRIGLDVDHVGGHVAAARFERGDLGVVGVENLLDGRVR